MFSEHRPLRGSFFAFIDFALLGLLDLSLSVSSTEPEKTAEVGGGTEGRALYGEDKHRQLSQVNISVF